ncbi:MAG: hypothetical protein MI717_03665 [Spirochaetales bacterium]|nr:hypothetical protein [Spirochaetales bacterium]
MKHRTLMLFVFFVTVLPLSALDISLDSVGPIALENNRMLLAKRIGVSSLERTRRSGWNQFVPNLSVGGGLESTQ